MNTTAANNHAVPQRYARPALDREWQAKMRLKAIQRPLRLGGYARLRRRRRIAAALAGLAAAALCLAGVGPRPLVHGLGAILCGGSALGGIAAELALALALARARRPWLRGAGLGWFFCIGLGLAAADGYYQAELFQDGQAPALALALLAWIAGFVALGAGAWRATPAAPARLVPRLGFPQAAKKPGAR